MLGKVVFLLAILQCQADEDVVIDTPLGSVLGSPRMTFQGQAYLSFQGFPFAQPPIGQLRFLPPQPVQSWSDTKDLTQDSQAVCPQKRNGDIPILFIAITSRFATNYIERNG